MRSPASSSRAAPRSAGASPVAGLLDRLPERLLDRLPERVRDPLNRGWRTLLSLLPTAARLPAVGVELRRWLPCWLLRIVAALLALGSAALVVGGGFGWTVAAVLAVVIVLRPATSAAVILTCVLGFALLQDQTRLWSFREPLLLLGTHACVALCLLLGSTSWAAKVQLATLVRPGLRFAVIQLSAQLIGGLGALIAGRELSWPWVPVAAALLILVLLVVWLPRLAVRDEPPAGRMVDVIDPSARRWGDEGPPSNPPSVP